MFILQLCCGDFGTDLFSVCARFIMFIFLLHITAVCARLIHQKPHHYFTRIAANRDLYICACFLPASKGCVRVSVAAWAESNENRLTSASRCCCPPSASFIQPYYTTCERVQGPSKLRASFSAPCAFAIFATQLYLPTIKR